MLIAATGALCAEHGAPILYRGPFETMLPRMAQDGFRGVELHLLDSAEIDRPALWRLLGENGLRLTFRLLDETHNDEIVKEELVSSDEFSVYVKLPRLGTCLIESAPL